MIGSQPKGAALGIILDFSKLREGFFKIPHTVKHEGLMKCTGTPEPQPTSVDDTGGQSKQFDG